MSINNTIDIDRYKTTYTKLNRNLGITDPRVLQKHAKNVFRAQRL